MLSYRRYTKFFGSSCQATADLSLYALENHQDWEQKIDKWQLPVLEDKYAISISFEIRL